MLEVTQELAEQVVMTNVGLKKQCVICDRYLDLDEFPFDAKYAWQRKDTCKECRQLLARKVD